MNIKIRYFFSFAFLFLLVVGNAQYGYDKEKLRTQNEQLRKQIAALSKSLNESKSTSQKSILYIKNLETKIDAQEQLISNTTKQKRLLEDEIYLSQLEINKLRRELDKLKGEYKDVLVNAYKNKSLQNKVLFVLASKSFTEAFRRVKYLEKYSGFQSKKADEIGVKQDEIQVTIKSREKAISDKEALLANQEIMREKLQGEKKEQNEILAEYRKNEGQIVAQIRTKESEYKKVEKEIERIIAEEVRIAREKAEAERKAREEAERKERERLAKLEAERVAKAKAEGKSEEEIAAAKPPEPKKVIPEKSFSATAEAEALSADFVSNKGKLPWPVSKGEVVGHFGRHPHPVIKNITVNNAGVKIASPKGTQARAVFDGTVSSVMSISGGTYAVVISHGKYYTLYYNITNVNVSKNQKVKTKDIIGNVYTDMNNDTILEFHVWRETNKENPETWLAGM